MKVLGFNLVYWSLRTEIIIMLYMGGVKLQFISEALDKIADLSAARKTGAVGLRSIMISSVFKLAKTGQTSGKT